MIIAMRPSGSFVVCGGASFKNASGIGNISDFLFDRDRSVNCLRGTANRSGTEVAAGEVVVGLVVRFIWLHQLVVLEKKRHGANCD